MLKIRKMEQRNNQIRKRDREEKRHQMMREKIIVMIMRTYKIKTVIMIMEKNIETR